MIGIIADPGESRVVEEFFELFKTPWEVYQHGRRYDVVLCAGDLPVEAVGDLILVYAGRPLRCDEQRSQCRSYPDASCSVSYDGYEIPIYGQSVSFPDEESGILRHKDSGQSALYVDKSSEPTFVRVGYDLFHEIRTVLTEGQPFANASIPTVELHISLLRTLITSCGIGLVEIPPVPEGYNFIACLTHDVDHALLRNHAWDHTLLGFLYRATFGSFGNFLRGRISSLNLLKNWAAVAKLPFVLVGLADDFWGDFVDRYFEVESGVPSTFFIIPFRNHAGMTSDRPAPSFRAAGYSAAEIGDKLRKLTAAGCEVGLHGIDAWRDSSRCAAELQEIRNLTGRAEIGVRMHWLYYDQKAPANLESAGAAYDSTVGYNETVGYRAGTTQVYRPLEADRLLELPLHAMDTALFYSGRLGLSPQQATDRLKQLASTAERHGGCVTINWHDRSLSPERLWVEIYRSLVSDLRNRGAWFASASQAVAWYSKRRSMAFNTRTASDQIPNPFGITTQGTDGLPGCRLRTHQPDGTYLDEALGFGTSIADHKTQPLGTAYFRN